MSVTLISPPPAFVFSRDTLKLKFQCTGLFAVEGKKAVNQLMIISSPIPAGSTIVFTYGSTEVTMTSADVPDDSGYQFSPNVSDTVLAEQLAANFVLSRDFEIAPAGIPNVILFTARKESLGFNFLTVASTYVEVKNNYSGVIAQEKPNYAVMFRLYCENAANTGFELIYEHNVPVTYGTSGIAEVPINDRLNDYIATEIRNNLPEIPTTGHLLCKKSCRRYYFEFAESYGAPVVVRGFKKSATFTVLEGGLSTLGEATTTLKDLIAPGVRAKDRFLKQGGLSIDTMPDQPQFLYFFNSRALTTVSLNCKFFFTDGSNAVITFQSFALSQYQKFGYQVTFDKIFIPDDYPTKKVRQYELWLTDNTGTVISESRFYVLDYTYRQYYKYFLNWSSWATMDTRMFYGKGSVELELVSSKADKINSDPSQIMHGTSLVYNITGQTNFSLTTGFIKDRSLLLFNRDFFLSPLKYLYSYGQFLPVEVTSKTIDEYADGENLYAQKFDWNYLFDDHAYTEGDVWKAPEIVPVPVGQVYFGSSVARPTTSAQVKALSSQSPGVYLFPLATGLNRFFVVAVPPGKAIGNVYSQTTDENLTSEFIYKAMVIDAMNYRLYVMEMAIPFSISNTLIISLIDV